MNPHDPAFPELKESLVANYDGEEKTHYESSGGITRLEYFAAAAMSGMLADPEVGGAPLLIAQSAFNIAEAMVTEAEKRRTKPEVA